MTVKSPQGWAIGAVVLTVLIACTPAPQDNPGAELAPTVPVTEPTAVPPIPGPTLAQAEQPGFAGLWAITTADCAEPDTGLMLAGDRIAMPADKRTCAVTSIEEEHPSGRAMNYNVKADCSTDGVASQDTFRIEFGPSDTVMQFRMNDAAPARMERCPSIETL